MFFKIIILHRLYEHNQNTIQNFYTDVKKVLLQSFLNKTTP